MAAGATCAKNDARESKNSGDKKTTHKPPPNEWHIKNSHKGHSAEWREGGMGKYWQPLLHSVSMAILYDCLRVLKRKQTIVWQF